MQEMASKRRGISKDRKNEQQGYKFAALTTCTRL